MCGLSTFGSQTLSTGSIAMAHRLSCATGKEEKGMTEDEMVGWHHQLDRHEFEQALGVGNGQGWLACYSP